MDLVVDKNSIFVSLFWEKKFFIHPQSHRKGRGGKSCRKLEGSVINANMSMVLYIFDEINCHAAAISPVRTSHFGKLLLSMDMTIAVCKRKKYLLLSLHGRKTELFLKRPKGVKGVKGVKGAKGEAKLHIILSIRRMYVPSYIAQIILVKPLFYLAAWIGIAQVVTYLSLSVDPK